jgi:hypothetical protein
MESRLKVPLKYKFPGFRLLHWYAGHHFAKQLKILNRKNIPIQENLYFGCKILKNTLKKWFSNRNDVRDIMRKLFYFLKIIFLFIKPLQDDTDDIPETLNCDAIIRILSKELKKSKVSVIIVSRVILFLLCYKQIRFY